MGCQLYYSNGFQVSGDGTDAEFVGNSFTLCGTRRESYITAENGARVSVANNSFRMPEPSSQYMGFQFPIEPIVLGSSFDEVVPLNGTWIKAVGSGTTVTHGRNQYDVPSWLERAEFVLSNGASCRDLGDNQYTGGRGRLRVVNR